MQFFIFYLIFRLFSGALQHHPVIPHRTTGRRLCTTDTRRAPSQRGGTTDAWSKCQQHAGIHQRNRKWKGNERQSTKRSRKLRVCNIAVRGWQFNSCAGKTIFCLTHGCECRQGDMATQCGSVILQSRFITGTIYWQGPFNIFHHND